MLYTNLSVRIEEPVKKSFTGLCERMGMNASVVVNAFIRTMLHEGKMPFVIKEYDPFYSKTTQARLASAYKQMLEGKGKEHELIEDVKETKNSHEKNLDGRSLGRLHLLAKPR